MQRLLQLSCCLILALSFQPPAIAADSGWIKAGTPRFNVYSQLNGADTLEWAQDFDLFISVIGQVITIDENQLPPLNIVLFNRERDFAPYRITTESGNARNVAGFFSNQGSWSIIGMPANSRRINAQQVTYHEAVHWYSSSVLDRYPLWFAEGLAEVFSTLEVDDDVVTWGSGIENHVGYLRAERLQPLEEFFRVSADSALHTVDTFYPQAWLFVHYLLFGDNQLNPDAFNTFLADIQRSGLRTAFENTFGFGYREMDELLQQYLRRGRYRTIQTTIDRAELNGTITDATQAEVALVLAKLAMSGNNLELAHQHAETLAQLAPREASTYDTIAMISYRMEDTPTLSVALNNAIALNTRDALTYRMQAEVLWNESPGLDPERARRIVNLFTRAIALQPYNLDDYRNLSRALAQTDSVNAVDRQIVEIGAAYFPNEAAIVIASAAAEYVDGNTDLAATLLDQALSGNYRMNEGDEEFAESFRANLGPEKIGTRITELTSQGRYEEALAELDAILSGEQRLSFEERNYYRTLRQNVYSNYRMLQVQALIDQSDFEAARTLLLQLSADGELNPLVRRQAENMLNRLPE